MFKKTVPTRLALGALIVTLLACGGLSRSSRAEEKAGPASEVGFVPLFNGKDLAGWKGDTSLWKVVDGVIMGSTDGNKIKHNTFLSTEKHYSDFVLRLSVKLRNHNSGIQFRSEQFPEFVVKGYQADVAEANFSGMLYDEGKRGFLSYWNKKTKEEKDAINAIAKMGEWNDYEITAKGSHIKMVLNGQTVCDIDDPEGAKEGVIALQLHSGADMLVSFKNLRIKELK